MGTGFAVGVAPLGPLLVSKRKRVLGVSQVGRNHVVCECNAASRRASQVGAGLIVSPWITALEAWSPILVGAFAGLLLMLIRYWRAALREKRRQYPPTTRPPDGGV